MQDGSPLSAGLFEPIIRRRPHDRFAGWTPQKPSLGATQVVLDHQIHARFSCPLSRRPRRTLGGIGRARVQRWRDDRQRARGVPKTDNRVATGVPVGTSTADGIEWPAICVTGPDGSHRAMRVNALPSEVSGIDTPVCHQRNCGKWLYSIIFRNFVYIAFWSRVAGLRANSRMDTVIYDRYILV